MAVRFIPEGYNTVSPYLMVTDIDSQLKFLKTVFNGEILERLSPMAKPGTEKSKSAIQLS